MNRHFRTPLVCCFLAPALASAATFKCVVDGRTVYQQQACSAEAAQVVIEHPAQTRTAPVKTPAPLAAPTATVTPPVQPDPDVRPRGELDAAGREAFARLAFQTLKRRDVETYKAMLCADAKLELARRELKGLLETFARKLASSYTEIGETLQNEPARVLFGATQREFSAVSERLVTTPSMPISVSLRRDADGRNCVQSTALSSTRAPKKAS